MFAPPILIESGQVSTEMRGEQVEVTAMFDLATVIRRFPLHELSIRRLYVRMPEFRSLCEDFATAKYALERWREDDGKVSDFQQLCEEIEAEIEEYIQGSLQALRQHHREEET